MGGCLKQQDDGNLQKATRRAKSQNKTALAENSRNRTQSGWNAETNVKRQIFEAMKKYNISDNELRDPKREWYDSEEVEAEIDRLKAENEMLQQHKWRVFDFGNPNTWPTHLVFVIIVSKYLHYLRENEKIAFFDHDSKEWVYYGGRRVDKPDLKELKWCYIKFPDEP